MVEDFRRTVGKDLDAMFLEPAKERMASSGSPNVEVERTSSKAS